MTSDAGTHNGKVCLEVLGIGSISIALRGEADLVLTDGDRCRDDPATVPEDGMKFRLYGPLFSRRGNLLRRLVHEGRLEG